MNINGVGNRTRLFGTHRSCAAELRHPLYVEFAAAVAMRWTKRDFGMIESLPSTPRLLAESKKGDDIPSFFINRGFLSPLFAAPSYRRYRLTKIIFPRFSERQLVLLLRTLGRTPARDAAQAATRNSHRNSSLERVAKAKSSGKTIPLLMSEGSKREAR